MLIIGLTGGIGSGKTTVAKLFEKKGIKIIDTDELARELTKPGEDAFNKIVAKFGESILTEDKTLDRAKLRKLVFNNDYNRVWLEELLHPQIREKISALIENIGSPYCIIVIPLLIETGKNPFIQRILVVDTDKDKQLERAHARDEKAGGEIYNIMSKQATREQRLRAADDVISNMGMLEDLVGQVDALHKYYLTLCYSKQDNSKIS